MLEIVESRKPFQRTPSRAYLQHSQVIGSWLVGSRHVGPSSRTQRIRVLHRPSIKRSLFCFPMLQGLDKRLTQASSSWRIYICRCDVGRTLWQTRHTVRNVSSKSHDIVSGTCLFPRLDWCNAVLAVFMPLRWRCCLAPTSWAELCSALSAATHVANFLQVAGVWELKLH